MLVIPTTWIHAQDAPTQVADGDSYEEYNESAEEQQPPPAESDSTSLKLIALNEKIMGGREKLLQLNNYELTYTVKEGFDEYQLVYTYMAPYYYRVDKTWRKLGNQHHEVMAFDGEAAWKQTLKPQTGIPQWIDKKERKSFVVDGEFFGPLFLCEGKKHVFDYQGLEKVANRPAYKVKAYLSDGRRIFYYFDKENYLINRIRQKDTFAGNELWVDCFITKRSPRQGYLWEEQRSWYVDGKEYRTQNLISVRVDKIVDKSIFSPPQRREYWLRQR